MTGEGQGCKCKVSTGMQEMELLGEPASTIIHASNNDTKGVHAGTSAVLPSHAQCMAAGLRRSSREGKSICYIMKEA